jgi:uncharacterized metal-binding protein YceD (DUF177 family)
MKIHLQDIPDEGLELSGNLNEELLAEDAKREEFTGPIHYDLQVYLTEDEDVIVNGSVKVPVRVTCARCSEQFDTEHALPDVQIVLDRPEHGEVELDEPLREELLITLPDYPHCDEEGPRESCPGREMLEQVKRESAEFDQQVEQENNKPDDRWSGLDDLKL